MVNQRGVIESVTVSGLLAYGLILKSFNPEKAQFKCSIAEERTGG